MMVVTGSESGLFVATVTTGAAAMAAATMGFYTHEAVARLLLLVRPDNHNNAGNARVEGRLSKMEPSVPNRMSVSLDVTNTKLGYLDKALKRALLLPPPRSSLAAATRVACTTWSLICIIISQMIMMMAKERPARRQCGGGRLAAAGEGGRPLKAHAAEGRRPLLKAISTKHHSTHTTL
jgi:hypothetical protein